MIKFSPVLSHLAALSSSLLFPPRSFFANVIVFAPLMSPSEFLNLLTTALRSRIYYPNAKSLIITNELWETGELIHDGLGLFTQLTSFNY